MFALLSQQNCVDRAFVREREWKGVTELERERGKEVQGERK